MSLKGWTPRYSINFYQFMVFNINNHRREIKSMKLVDEVAKTLGVRVDEIMVAFMLWGSNGYPQEYFFPITQGTKDKGGKYEIGILIWNYQGGHQGNQIIPNPMGVIKKARTWGKGYKTIGVQETFNLGTLA